MSDIFLLYLPLPYRVLALFNLGFSMWYLNLLAFKTFQIDILTVLKIPHQDINIKQLVANTRSTLIQISVCNFVNYITYVFFMVNNINFQMLKWFPLLGVIFTVFIIFNPNYLTDESKSTESIRLKSTFSRIIVGNIDTPLRNNDILFTDTLTSYNKVFVDFLVYISGLFLGLDVLPNPEIKNELSKSHIEIYNLDLLLANFPSALRLKQCLSEYHESKGQNKTHLLNAIKYSTSFLPTFCMILKRAGYLQTDVAWYFSSLINSSYSFYWDISNDWNFGFFHKHIMGSELPALRKKMIYDIKFYYFAIFVDFQLRFIWLYKLHFLGSSTTLNSTSLISNFFLLLFTTEAGHFTVEILELVRRWVWVFVKVEVEHLKMKNTGEDIELQNLK